MRELFLDGGESGRKRESNFDGIYKEWEHSRSGCEDKNRTKKGRRK